MGFYADPDAGCNIWLSAFCLLVLHIYQRAFGVCGCSKFLRDKPLVVELSFMARSLMKMSCIALCALPGKIKFRLFSHRLARTGHISHDTVYVTHILQTPHPPLGLFPARLNHSDLAAAYIARGMTGYAAPGTAIFSGSLVKREPGGHPLREVLLDVVVPD